MDEPGPLADQRLVPGLAQLVAARGGAPVLPDERAVDRLAGRRVPGDDGLALVGDPDRVELGAAGCRRRRAPRSRPAASPPRSPSASCSTQPGPREVLLELRVGAARRSAPRRRRRGRSSRSCPGRSRGSLAAQLPLALREGRRASEVDELAGAVGEAGERCGRWRGGRGRARTRAAGSRRGRRRSSSRSPSRSRGRRAASRAGPRPASPAGRRSARSVSKPQRRRIAQRAKPSATPKPPPTRRLKAATARSHSPRSTASTSGASARGRGAEVAVAEQDQPRRGLGAQRRLGRGGRRCRPCRAGGRG